MENREGLRNFINLQIGICMGSDCKEKAKRCYHEVIELIDQEEQQHQELQALREWKKNVESAGDVLPKKQNESDKLGRVILGSAGFNECLDQLTPLFQKLKAENLELKEKLQTQIDIFNVQNKALASFEKCNKQLQAELTKAKEETVELNKCVKEWICISCNTVYPGYPYLTPFSLNLICPKCNKTTLVKRDSSAEVILLKQEITRLRGLLNEIKYKANYQEEPNVANMNSNLVWDYKEKLDMICNLILKI